MTDDDDDQRVDPAIVQAWVAGWTLARGTALPVPDAGGWRVDVGWPQQRVRYVFPHCSEGLRGLAHSIVEPWIFLKVCAAPDAMQPLLPQRWVIQPLGFMMTGTARKSDVTDLPMGYRLDVTEGAVVPTARILTTTGELAAIGRVAFPGDFAVYDRIETHQDHRRRGLASAIMAVLRGVALARGKTSGLLVATADGRALYDSLGWQLYSLYTTAVIPPHEQSDTGIPR